MSVCLLVNMKCWELSFLWFTQKYFDYNYFIFIPYLVGQRIFTFLKLISQNNHKYIFNKKLPLN